MISKKRSCNIYELLLTLILFATIFYGNFLNRALNIAIRQASKAELLHSPPLINLEHLKGRVAYKDWLKKLLIHFIEIKHLVKDSIEQPPMS